MRPILWRRGTRQRQSDRGGGGRRWCRSFVSVVPDVEDVLDDDGQRGQRAEGDRDVGDHRVGDDVGEQKPTGRTADPDAEVAEGVVEVGVHGWRNQGSNATHPTEETSATFEDVIVNDVPLTLEETL